MNAMKPPFRRLPWFMMLFLSIFGFIGVAVLIFLWSPSSDGFGAPPLFFRIFGSLIAVAFMAMGFGLPLTVLLGRSVVESSNPIDSAFDKTGPAGSPREVGYRCPHCGAALGKEQEVSPKGDVKCSYCHKWWTIHQ